ALRAAEPADAPGEAIGQLERATARRGPTHAAARGSEPSVSTCRRRRARWRRCGAFMYERLRTNVEPPDDRMGQRWVTLRRVHQRDLVVAQLRAVEDP